MTDDCEVSSYEALVTLRQWLQRNHLKSYSSLNLRTFYSSHPRCRLALQGQFSRAIAQFGPSLGLSLDQSQGRNADIIVTNFNEYQSGEIENDHHAQSFGHSSPYSENLISEEIINFTTLAEHDFPNTLHLNLNDKNVLETFVKGILQEGLAYATPKLCAKLCRYVGVHNETTEFRTCLLTCCESAFMSRNLINGDHLLTFIRFIGELYNYNELTESSIKGCIHSMLEHNFERAQNSSNTVVDKVSLWENGQFIKDMVCSEEVEAVCVLISTVLTTLQRKVRVGRDMMDHAEIMSRYLYCLEILSKSPTVSYKAQTAIKEILTELALSCFRLYVIAKGKRECSIELPKDFVLSHPGADRILQGHLQPYLIYYGPKLGLEVSAKKVFVTEPESEKENDRHLFVKHTQSISDLDLAEVHDPQVKATVQYNHSVELVTNVNRARQLVRDLRVSITNSDDHTICLSVEGQPITDDENIQANVSLVVVKGPHDDDPIFALDVLTEKRLLKNSGLAKLLTAPSTRIVLHDATKNQGALLNQFGVYLNSVYDTQLGYQKVEDRAKGEKRAKRRDLNYVLSKLKVESSGCLPRTTDNTIWTERPLTDIRLKEAGENVEYLKRLVQAISNKKVDFNHVVKKTTSLLRQVVIDVKKHNIQKKYNATAGKRRRLRVDETAERFVKYLLANDSEMIKASRTKAQLGNTFRAWKRTQHTEDEFCADGIGSMLTHLFRNKMIVGVRMDSDYKKIGKLEVDDQHCLLLWATSNKEKKKKKKQTKKGGNKWSNVYGDLSSSEEE